MDSATLLAPFLSLVVFNVVVVVSSLIVCKKTAPKESTAPVVPSGAPDGDAKVEVKEKSKKEQSKKETSKKNGSVKKSVKEQKSKKETSKKEKEKSVKKEVKEDKPASPIGDDGKKNEEPEKAEEKKEGQENTDKKEEEKKPEEKKEEDKKNGEADPSTSPAAQTAMQLVKKVAVEPAELRFSQTGGTSKLTVTNNTGSRIAVKIKCSDNNLFRVNPVFSFVEKDGKGDIEVSRTTGNVKPDKLGIATTEVADDAKDAPAIFKDLAADKITTINVAMHVN